ncbi:MAG TPA: lysylphosphatidylglycerol synthase transmembrane domain-containing protein [Solirubrobacteraceae bacterium]|jgi:phosphatidylinositol alpha-mannosyltransferase|nr:lysylphosphatidylglycerol synthase transmembrane domain-containing protein [Solirubrobacteraceae bacterium]
MGTPENPTRRRHWGVRRRVATLALAVLLAGLVVFALSRLDLHGIGHALTTANPGWIALAVALMMLSLFLRASSWHQSLRAALPETPIRWPPVIRATMIGVMASAVFPGRVGEPTRMLVLSRDLDGPTRRLLPVVAGTVFSQTLINLLALAILAGVTFSSVTLPGGNVAGIATVLAVPLAIVALVVAGPRLMALGQRSHSERIARWAATLARLFSLARQGLTVFARPRYGITASGLQLLAWVLQWLSCYAVILALGLNADLTAAAAVLLAVNVSAILPATPSNIGVFQAACLVVLSAYGVGTSEAVAYGIILQAVEVVTALTLGVPALLAEGLSWEDIRPTKLPSEGS